MALLPTNIGVSIDSNLKGFSIVGQADPLLAQGIGNTIGAWALTPGNILVTGVTTGTGGAGAVLGKLGVPPVPGASAIMLGAGAIGPMASAIAESVNLGVSASFTAMAQYAGASVGVGVGADVSMVVSVQTGVLISMLMAFPPAYFAGMPTGGQKPLCTGIGLIVSAQLALAVGGGAVVGPPSPSAAAGISNSVIF